MKKYKFECSDVGYGVLKPVDGGFRVTDEITVVRHSEALDWFESFLSKETYESAKTLSTFTHYQLTQYRAAMESLNRERARLRALIAAERGK